jgi:hypothetical protein
VYYLSNLPTECQPPIGKRGERVTGTPDVVRRTVRETRRLLAEPSTWWTPLFAARNLHGVLDDEKLSGVEAINRTLRPFWATLWRLAARGHYAVTQQPVRASEAGREAVVQPPIPPMTQDGYTLSFTLDHGRELHALLSLPGAYGPLYPISGFPKLTEFRAMLQTVGMEGERRWDGRHFFAYVVADPPGISFRAHDNGITFGFSAEAWTKLRALFDRAWMLPDVRGAWDVLSGEYGEL